MTETTQPDPWQVTAIMEDQHSVVPVEGTRIPTPPASKPLTVADIPAGQGPASLFLHHGRPAYKDTAGHVRGVTIGGYPEGAEALETLLAAALPAIAET